MFRAFDEAPVSFKCTLPTYFWIASFSCRLHACTSVNLFLRDLHLRSSLLCWAFGFYRYIGITLSGYNIAQARGKCNPQSYTKCTVSICCNRWFLAFCLFCSWHAGICCAIMDLLGGLPDSFSSGKGSGLFFFRRRAKMDKKRNNPWRISWPLWSSRVISVQS